jgi:hypothetical protein
MLIYFIYKYIVNKAHQQYRRHATSVATFRKILYATAPHNEHQTQTYQKRAALLVAWCKVSELWSYTAYFSDQ